MGMGLLYISIASILSTVANLCLRKNAEQQKSANGYLTLYFVSSFLISFAVANVSIDNFRFVMPSIGAIAGILSLLLMGLLSLALQIGPSGLTFSFQNSASIFPSLSFFFIFGPPFGFNINFYMLFGFCLIIVGLFLSSRKQNDQSLPNIHLIRWLALAIAIFFIQGLILSLFQWRTLLLLNHAPEHPLIPWKCCLSEDNWFMPAFFFIPAILQALIFGVKEKRCLSLRETLLGAIAGLLNGGATFLVLMATKYTQSSEKMILFPWYAVSLIFLCHLWGKFFYKEKIYWPGMLLCLSGIFIGLLAV